MTDYERRTYPKDKHDDVPGIFGRMDPMPGAIEAFHELSQLFDTYVLVHRALGEPLGLVRQAPVGAAPSRRRC